jgi:hypothetical protein
MEPIKATLSKRRIGDIIARIKAGESVEPEAAAWSVVDCLMVAGVLLSTAVSAETRLPVQSGSRPGAAKMLHDLQAAIEFVGALGVAYDNGSWDEYFEPTVTIGIRADGGITPLGGFKR